MNFEQGMAYVQRLSRETLAIMIEIQSRPPGSRMPPSWHPHQDQRLKDMKRMLAEMDERLRRLRGLL